MTRALSLALLVAFAACGPVGSSTAVPDFSLTDVNPNSARSGQSVAPKDYRGKVSAWYFGHST